MRASCLHPRLNLVLALCVVRSVAEKCANDFECQLPGQPICSANPVTGTCCSCQTAGFNWSTGGCACKENSDDCKISGPFPVGNPKECISKCEQHRGCHGFEGIWNTRSVSEYAYNCTLFKLGATGDGNAASSKTCYHFAKENAECNNNVVHPGCDRAPRLFCCPTSDGQMEECCDYHSPADLGQKLIWCVVIIFVAAIFGFFVVLSGFLVVSLKDTVGFCTPSASENHGQWEFMNGFRPQHWLPPWPFFAIGGKPPCNWAQDLVTKIVKNTGARDYQKIEEATNKAFNDQAPSIVSGPERHSTDQLLSSPWDHRTSIKSLNEVSATPLLWVTFGFALQWIICIITPAYVMLCNECPSEQGGYVHSPASVYIPIIPTILVAAFIESKVLTYILPMFAVASGVDFKMFSGIVDFTRAPFWVWRLVMAICSGTSQLSFWMNAAFLGKALKMDACPHSPKFTYFWKKKQQGAFLGYVARTFFGIELSWANEATLLFFFMFAQPLYAALYAFPRQVCCRRLAGWREIKLRQQTTNPNFSVLFRPVQNLSGSLSIMADVGYMYSINFSDHKIAKNFRENSSKPKFEDDEGFYKDLFLLLMQHLTRGSFQILLSGLLQGAFMLHLQIALMALLWSSMDAWSNKTFATILLNMVKLSTKIYTEGRRWYLCKQLLQDIRSEIPHGDIFKIATNWEVTKMKFMCFIYSVGFFFYVLSLAYIVLKIRALYTCPFGFATFTSCLSAA